MGIIEEIFSIDVCFDRFCGNYRRTMLKQLDVLLESRDSEWDEFSLGVVQGICMAIALRRRMEGLQFGYEPFYSWEDVRSIRESGCLREIRGVKMENLLKELYEKQQADK